MMSTYHCLLHRHSLCSPTSILQAKDSPLMIRACSFPFSQQAKSICPRGREEQGQRKRGEKGKKKRGQNGKQLRSLEWGKGPSGDGELAWGSRALRACVFVFLFGHCSSKAELCPSHGNDAAGHNRLQ